MIGRVFNWLDSSITEEAWGALSIDGQPTISAPTTAVSCISSHIRKSFAKAMEMHSDFLHLAERLVTAVEEMSKDVKNMSTYMYDLNQNVSHLLYERKEEGISAEVLDEVDNVPSAPPSEGPETSIVSEHSLLHEEADVRSLPHSDVLEQVEIVVENAASTDIDYNENSMFVEVNIKGQFPREGDSELHESEKTFDNGRDNVKSRRLKPASHASHSTADDTVGQAEVVGRYFEEEQVVGVIRKKSTDQDESNARHEGTKSASLKSLSTGSVGEKRKRNFYCSTCKKTFARKDLSVEPLQDHSYESQLQCRECGTAVRHSNTLAMKARARAGGRKQTQMAGRPFKCNQCGKAFKRSDYLIAHVRTHTGERPFQCDRCGRRFKQPVEVTKHMRIHSLERPYQCDQCDKAFKRKEYLVAHKNVHSGKKSFQCYECGRLFAKQSNCLAHLHTHSGEKPFKCSQCDKSFARNSSLTVHMRIHTGERPYVCSLCGKCCTTAGNLNSHKRHMHTAAPSSS